MQNNLECMNIFFLSLVKRKINEMKGTFIKHCIVIFLVSIFSEQASSQEITFDAKTLYFDAGKDKFEVGEILKIKVTEYDPSKEELEFEISFSDVSNVEGIKRFKSILDKDKSLKSSSGLEVYFLSFKIENKDYTHIKIKRKQGTTISEERTYSFKNKLGIKFDVSTGFFATKIRDRAYVLRYVTDSTREIVREQNGKFRGGVGILAHLHSRWCSWLNGGVSLGFELNGDARVSYLGGFSVFVGRDQKFVFTGGLAASKANVLSKAYSEGQIINAAITQVPVVSVWKYGWFFGATYNF